MLTTFYCTQCGAHLEVDGYHAEGFVLCGSCHRRTRIPDGAKQPLFVARVVVPENPEIEAYVASWPEDHRDNTERPSWHDVIAAKLANVEADENGHG